MRPPEDTTGAAPVSTLVLESDNLSFAYGSNEVLKNVSVQLHQHRISAFIGPSGCGKSTLLRCFNRINDLIDSARITGGCIRYRGVDTAHPDLDVIALRRRIGMVFQKYNPFPKSVFDNAAYGLRIAGWKEGKELKDAVEQGLRDASLWDEVKDRLDDNALGLSGGQQQRLCIARTLAVKPDVVLMDEPCSALDPIATARVEETILALRERYTIVIVTHNMEQARRIADTTSFFLLGRLIETGPTDDLFLSPRQPETGRYLSGEMG
jgi:phosphate transport system ATP-binding protein